MDKRASAGRILFNMVIYVGISDVTGIFGKQCSSAKYGIFLHAEH